MDSTRIEGRRSACAAALARWRCTTLLWVGLLLGPGAWALPLTWSLTEFQPNVAQGGRANTIAVKPGSPATMIVASETGGLFRTSDEGITWQHIEGLLPFTMGSVAYLPTDPTIVIATAVESFLSANAGGIWRSTDGGTTWSHIPDPPALPGSGRFSAGAISVAPDTGKIFVATSSGVSISADNGATWTTAQPFGSARAASVLAMAGDVVLAGAPWSGLRRSTDGGVSWSPAATAPTGVADMHAFARSPFASTQAYVVDQDTHLFVTEDGGIHWSPIASAPSGGGACGGIAFVKAVSSPVSRGSLRLYFGNRCGLSRLAAPRIAGTQRFDYSGAWTALTLDHGDTRDLVFKRTGRFVRPVLLATDGGLHRTTDAGLTWTLTGGGVNGYNALQITEVKGQWINDVGRYDLYFGTQDNNNFASSNLGATWPNAICCEGFFFEMEKRVATAADSQVTFVACGPCGNLRSAAVLAGTVGWANPPGALAGNPAIVNRSVHVQGVNAEAGFAAGLAVTRDLGTTWAQYAAFPEQRSDLPKLTRRPFFRHFTLPVQYQSIRTGFDAATGIAIQHLVRLSMRLSGSDASVYYPAMTGFGGLGINPTMFAWYQVFGVDPSDSRFIIAPDIVNEKMMQTHDGGDHWTELPALTALVTDSGRFQFRTDVFPLASAVSLAPSPASMVAVGTHENGLMLSADRGATWAKVPGSERATYITSVEWRSATDAFVSTYGRGLWRLRGVFDIPEFQPLCRIVDCRIRWIDRGDPPPDERLSPGIVVFDGRVQGVRVESGQIAEVFVSPGSSIGFVPEAAKASKIKITESSKSIGLRGKVAGARWPAGDVQVVALALDAKRALRGFATARSVVPVAAAIAAPAAATEAAWAEPPESSTVQSPVARRPYLTLSVPGQDVERLTTAERLTVSGVRFPAGATLELIVDGELVEKAGVREDGSFAAVLAAPSMPGMHTLVVREAGSKDVIDGAQFKVSRGAARPARRDGGPADTHDGRERVGKNDEREDQGEHDEDERAGERVRVRPPTRGR